MRSLKKYSLTLLALLVLSCSLPLLVAAQGGGTVLTGAELTRVVPPGFYYQGQTAPTQMRNAAAARFGSKSYVIAGLVDTSGYSADIRAQYEGFFITDSPISLNGSRLDVGAYGFGSTNDGKLNILDLAGNKILSVSATKDNQLKRPRPLSMAEAGNGIRLYMGKYYVTIAAR